MKSTSAEQVYVRTPLIESISLRQFSSGRKVYLKLENCQPSGSFKLRGITALCKYARSQGFQEVVCPSGGNAGLATAYAAMQLGMACHIVVNRKAPNSVCETIKSYGATLDIYGEVWEEAKNFAVKLAISKPAFLVHPFDHEEIWEGHSTIVDEIAEDLDTAPSLLVTCCGGGGLLAGLIRGVRRRGWHNRTKVLVMETQGAHSFNHSVKNGGQRTRLESITSIANCLGANEVCEQVMADFRVSQPPILSRVVTDADAAQSCIHFANEHRFLVGLSCGATLAALYKNRVKSILTNDEKEHETIYDVVNGSNFNHNSDGPIVVVVCGGAEITLRHIEEYNKLFNIK